jgi:hypothetical protein
VYLFQNVIIGENPDLTAVQQYGFYQFIKKIKLAANRKIMFYPLSNNFVHSLNGFFRKMFFLQTLNLPVREKEISK